ncbi:MAG: AmmeMemoRadiSam system protein A [Candidatus Promineifilaceae bacterium]
MRKNMGAYQRSDDSESTPGLGFTLREPQKQLLLLIAREAIEKEGVKDTTLAEALDDEALNMPAAVFVTLWAPGSIPGGAPELRGCIGQLNRDMPLYRAVQLAASGAARRDPRFPPVGGAEAPTLRIEIAILTPLEPVATLKEIEIGRDGLVIESGGYRGLLLPKVASRLHWDAGEFVRGVCTKAGLPGDTWPARGKLSRFQTMVIEESAP